MKKLLIALALLGLGCGAAYADTVTFSPDSQSAPVSTTATFSVTNFDLFPGTPEFIEFSWSVLSGPDMGQGFGVIVFCLVECGFDLSVQNNGVSGTDVVEAGSVSLANGTTGFTSGTITWTTSSSAPEPAALPLIGAGLTAILAFGRRRVAVRR